MPSLRSLLGMLLLKGPGFILAFGLLAGLIALIALGLLSCGKFEISGMFTSVRLVLYLWRFELTFFVCVTDSSWLSWSREAEASLARAYLVSNPGSYVGRGFLSICTIRLGGRCHDRIHRVDRADEFDVTHSGFFLSELFSCTCSALSTQFRLCMQCS